MLKDKIKEYRIRNNISQIEMAKKLHITRQAYNHYETGRRIPPVPVLIDIAKILNTDIAALSSTEEEAKKPAVPEDSELSEIKSIFEQLSPDNRAKLLELSNLYLSAQHKSEENK